LRINFEFLVEPDVAGPLEALVERIAIDRYPVRQAPRLASSVQETELDSRVVNTRERLANRTWELCGVRTADPRVVLNHGHVFPDAEYRRLSNEHHAALRAVRPELMDGKG